MNAPNADDAGGVNIYIYIRKLSCGFTPDYISTGSKWMMNVFWGRGEVEKYIEPTSYYASGLFIRDSKSVADRFEFT